MVSRRLQLTVAGVFAFAVAVLAADIPGQAPTTPDAARVPDLNGLWKAPYTPDLSVAYGKDLPFTAVGRERWTKVDTAKDPTGFCLPVGPARGIQAPFPFQIVQTPGLVAILFEYQRTYRMIHTDGRKPPDDIDEYPEWMGFSTGRWQDDTLVVDTVAINDRSWLDTAGPRTQRQAAPHGTLQEDWGRFDRVVRDVRGSSLLHRGVDRHSTARASETG
jgi:hypothetical protein